MPLPLVAGILSSIAPKIVGGITDLIGEFVEDKDEANRLANAIAGKVLDILGVELTVKGNIITAEAKSMHWLTATWRPITMLVFVIIIANNYIVYPYLSLFWSEAPAMEVPDQMWALLKIGIGGYITSRGVEKVVETWKGG